MNHETIARLVHELVKSPETRVKALETGDYSLTLSKKELTALKFAFNKPLAASPNGVIAADPLEYWV